MDTTRAIRRPASVGHLLKVGVAIAVLIGAVFLLMIPPLPAADPDAALAEHFEVGELPFGFRVGRADRLLSGEVVVALESDDERAAQLAPDELGVEEDPERATLADDEPGELDEHEDPDGVADEASLDELDAAERRERHALEDGTPPAGVYLVRFPRERAKEVQSRVLARHTDVKGDDDDEDADDDDGSSHDDWKLTIEGGQLEWGAYDADFVHERKFLAGDHFEDVVRINLTRGEQCWVLFAVWPRDYRGSQEPVERLLSALPPL